MRLSRKSLGIKEVSFDHVDGLDETLPFVALKDGSEKWMVTRLDYLIAMKVLSVFHNFQRKPDQLNYEVPKLVTAGIEMYGEHHMWQLIRRELLREMMNSLPIRENMDFQSPLQICILRYLSMRESRLN